MLGRIQSVSDFASTPEELQRTFNNESWFAQASYVLTGEQNSYKSVTPRHNFDPKEGTWGAFELGDKPIMRVSGREPAYWRGGTYDRYSGRVMTISAACARRLPRITRNDFLNRSLSSFMGKAYNQRSTCYFATSVARARLISE